jgi:hypothetical protein
VVWLSLAKRGGEPIAVALEATPNNAGGLDCGLLFVRAHVTNPRVVLRLAGTEEHARVRLPNEALNLPTDAFVLEETLAPDTQGGVAKEEPDGPHPQE